MGAGEVEGEGADEVGGDVGDGGELGAEEEPAPAEALQSLRLGEDAVVVELHPQPHSVFHCRTERGGSDHRPRSPC